MMTVRTMSDVLAEEPFFQGLTPDQIGLVAGCAEHVHFRPGEFLCREGEPADAFFLIRGGRVGVEIATPRGGALTIRSVSDGGIVGWSWLFPPYRWHFDAHVTRATRATRFDGACLRAKLDADPAFGYAMMARFAQVMIRQIAGARMQLLDVYGQRPEGDLR